MRRLKQWLVLMIVIFLASACTVLDQPGQSTPTPVVVPTPVPVCGEAWQTRVRKPERFLEIDQCVVFQGTVIDVKLEKDGDVHIPVLPDGPAQQYVNEQNAKNQAGGILVEIEPWERGERTTADDPTNVNAHAVSPAHFCPGNACPPQRGDRVRVTSFILLDKDHRWNEAHSPANIEVIAPGTEADRNPMNPPEETGDDY